MKLHGLGLKSCLYAMALNRLTDGPLTTQELASALGISAGGITGTIDYLEKRGLVTRLDDPRDRRKVIVKITQKGFDIVIP